MARVKIKKRRRNPTSVVTSSGGGGGEVASWELVGAGGVGYAGTRVVGSIGGGLGARRGARRGGKVLLSGAVLIAVYLLVKKFPSLRKYRTALMTGAVIAFMQAVIEEYVPKLGGLLGLNGGANANMQQQIAAVQQQQRRIFANRTVIPHSDDAMYDAMEQAAERPYQPPAPEPQYQQAPQQAQQAPQGGDELDGEDFGQGIFTVE